MHFQVTRPMIDADDTVEGIRHLTEHFGEQGEEYQLIIKPVFKKFKVYIFIDSPFHFDLWMFHII